MSYWFEVVWNEWFVSLWVMYGFFFFFFFFFFVGLDSDKLQLSVDLGRIV